VSKVKKFIPIVRAFFNVQRFGVLSQLFSIRGRGKDPPFDFANVPWIEVILQAKLPESHSQVDPLFFEELAKEIAGHYATPPFLLFVVTILQHG
jgi:hypothetical protein